MKIEKINDRQIRCTLSRSDLESRKIQLSELIGGGEKMRGLFREMLSERLRRRGSMLRTVFGEPELSGNALSLPLRVELCAGDTQELERLTGLSWDPAEAYDPAKLPAVVLARGGPEDTWELARRWHSTQERIRDMNRDAAPGDLLLIVRECL